MKDEEHVAASAALGRFTEDDAVAIHAVGARVKAEIEAGDRWWDERWREWTPPPEMLDPARRCPTAGPTCPPTRAPASTSLGTSVERRRPDSRRASG